MKKAGGFTLIEILISLSILVIGVVGILTLFPAGLNSTRQAIEDTYAAMVAESAVSALRTSVTQMAPGDELIFFHDGILQDATDNNRFTIPDADFSIGVPGPKEKADNSAIAITEYLTELNANANTNFCRLAQGDVANLPFNVTLNENDQPGQLSQYSFNIELSYPKKQVGQEHLFPQGLFDVVVRVRRGNRLIKKYYTKIFVPTDKPNNP